jgi:glycosyltransferase involved in cell wall biosynthesis
LTFVAEVGSAAPTTTEKVEPKLRVAIAHEWLIRYAGSERCVDEMLGAFPDARLLTTIARPECLPRSFHVAETSWLQHIPGALEHHEWLVPVMPLAWQLRKKIHDVDIVISSSHACAKAVRVAHGIPHLCYCHTPMRYAWDFDSERGRFPALIRPPAKILLAGLRRWDRGAASGVTCFVANSRAVADRIRRNYRRAALVIHPPVRTDYFTPGGERDEFFLYAGRLVSYKRPDLVVDAFAGLPQLNLVVAGSGPMLQELQRRATPNVRFVDAPDDSELRALYRAARGVVHAGEEDFGISMAEAQACGTPLLALRRGGALDIVLHGETGLFFDTTTPEAVQAAVRASAGVDWDVASIAASAQRFSSQRFNEEIRAVVSDLVEGRDLSGIPT